jgi:mono/diheme cytochrome c family protein
VSHRALLATAAALAITGVGCRAGKSQDPPLHLQADMDWQTKAQPQEASGLFADGRAMRPLEEGTIARGTLKEGALATGMRNGKHVQRAPIVVDQATLDRGRDRYGIYCTPCHDATGSGRGMVVSRGFPPPIDLAGDRVREMPDGQIFEPITKGIRNMPSYAAQIPAADRWAITAWVRVLGRSQHGSLDDVPPAKRGAIQAAPAAASPPPASPAPAPTATGTKGDSQ